METNNPYQPVPPVTDNSKTASIISYFWFIGWLVAYFAMHKDQKTELGSYQLRQTLLFHLVSTVISWVIGFVIVSLLFSMGFFYGLYLLRLVQVALLILWIIGLIGAINGQKKPIPFIGERAQTMFPGI